MAQAKETYKHRGQGAYYIKIFDTIGETIYILYSIYNSSICRLKIKTFVNLYFL